MTKGIPNRIAFYEPAEKKALKICARRRIIRHYCRSYCSLSLSLSVYWMLVRNEDSPSFLPFSLGYFFGISRRFRNPEPGTFAEKTGAREGSRNEENSVKILRRGRMRPSSGEPRLKRDRITTVAVAVSTSDEVHLFNRVQ